MMPAGLTAGLVLPESVLHSTPFTILATFVALNTLMYATLAVLKLVPRVRPLRSRGRDRRTQDRSIYGEGAAMPAPRGAAPVGASPAGPGASGPAHGVGGVEL